MDKNKYSKYFDDKFNFSNEVKPRKRNTRLEEVRKLQNFSCSGGIMLEPRLQEYLKKKKFYKKTQYQPCVSPEREFQITQDDLKRIKAFLSGDKKIYDKKRFPLKQKKHKKPKFPSSAFREDKRLDKLRKKKKELMNKEPINRGMFEDDKQNFYNDSDMFQTGPLDGRDIIGNNFDQGLANTENYDYDTVSMESYDDPFKGKHTYTGNDFGTHDPMGYPDQRVNLYPERGNDGPLGIDNVSNQWNPYIEYNHMQGSGYSDIHHQRFGKEPDPIFNQRNEMDFDNKMVIPKMNYNGKKDLNHSNIRPLPNMTHGNGMRDTDLESCIQFGMPSKTFKSYGYRNPDEHYFQFIQNDIQDPNHVVFPIARGGISTRLDNKKHAKNYKRDIY